MRVVRNAAQRDLRLPVSAALAIFAQFRG